MSSPPSKTSLWLPGSPPAPARKETPGLQETLGRIGARVGSVRRELADASWTAVHRPHGGRHVD